MALDHAAGRLTSATCSPTGTSRYVVHFTNETTMDKVILASEANRQFSRILREVAEGDIFIITSHGRPIARIVPAEAKGSEGSKQRLLEHLRSQTVVDIGPFKREELYDC